MPTISTLGQVRELPWEEQARRVAMQNMAWNRQDQLLAKQDQKQQTMEDRLLKIAQMQNEARRYEFDQTAAERKSERDLDAADFAKIQTLIAASQNPAAPGAAAAGPTNKMVIDGKEVSVPAAPGSASPLEQFLAASKNQPKPQPYLSRRYGLLQIGGGGNQMTPKDIYELSRQAEEDARRRKKEDDAADLNRAIKQAQLDALERGVKVAGVKGDIETANLKQQLVEADPVAKDLLAAANASKTPVEKAVAMSRYYQKIGKPELAAQETTPGQPDLAEIGQQYAGVAPQVEDLSEDLGAKDAFLNAPMAAWRLLTGDKAALEKEDEVGSQLNMVFENAIRNNVDVRQVRDALRAKSSSKKFRQILDNHYLNALSKQRGMLRRPSAPVAGAAPAAANLGNFMVVGK